MLVKLRFVKVFLKMPGIGIADLAMLSQFPAFYGWLLCPSVCSDAWWILLCWPTLAGDRAGPCLSGPQSVKSQTADKELSVDSLLYAHCGLLTVRQLPRRSSDKLYDVLTEIREPEREMRLSKVPHKFLW